MLSDALWECRSGHRKEAEFTIPSQGKGLYESEGATGLLNTSISLSLTFWGFFGNRELHVGFTFESG